MRPTGPGRLAARSGAAAAAARDGHRRDRPPAPPAGDRLRRAGLHRPRGRRVLSQRRRPRRRRPRAGRSCSGTCCPAAGVDAPRAWANLLADHHPGGRGVTVAILDTGVAYRNWKEFTESPDFPAREFVSPYDFVAHNAYPLDRNGPRHVRRRRGRGVDQQQRRSDRPGLRRLDHAGAGARLPGRGRRGDDRPRHPVRASSITRSVINLSLEFLPSQVTRPRRSRRSSRRSASPAATAWSWSAPPATTRPTRSPIRRACRGSSRSGATTRDRCLADYSNGGPAWISSPPAAATTRSSRDPDCHPAAQPALDLPADAHRSRRTGTSSATPTTTSAPRWPRPRSPPRPRW